MDRARHVSRCLPESQDCGISKGSIEHFRRCFDPFGVSCAGPRERIGHGYLLSPSRWSSSSTSRMDGDRERSLREHSIWKAEKLLASCSLEKQELLQKRSSRGVALSLSVNPRTDAGRNEYHSAGHSPARSLCFPISCPRRLAVPIPPGIRPGIYNLVVLNQTVFKTIKPQ